MPTYITKSPKSITEDANVSNYKSLLDERLDYVAFVTELSHSRRGPLSGDDTSSTSLPNSTRSEWPEPFTVLRNAMGADPTNNSLFRPNIPNEVVIIWRATCRRGGIDSVVLHAHNIVSAHRKFKISHHFNPKIRKIVAEQSIGLLLFGYSFAETCKNAKALETTAKEVLLLPRQKTNQLLPRKKSDGNHQRPGRTKGQGGTTGSTNHATTERRMNPNLSPARRRGGNSKDTAQALNFAAEKQTRSKRIKVQPTSIARKKDRGLSRGSNRIQAGRPSEAERKRRRKHDLSDNIRRNQPNAKIRLHQSSQYTFEDSSFEDLPAVITLVPACKFLLVCRDIDVG
nr:unnamed protein product [Callosobruchus analis]